MRQLDTKEGVFTDDDFGFYTLKGYEQNDEAELTPSMEDYLEMIARLSLSNEIVRVGDVSKMLHVKPSSATKMIQALTAHGYLKMAKYGFIFLTDKGRTEGNYLLYRHEIINRFLCVLNRSKNELEQAEKIEHFLNVRTIKNLDELTQKIVAYRNDGAAKV